MKTNLRHLRGALFNQLPVILVNSLVTYGALTTPYFHGWASVIVMTWSLTVLWVGLRYVTDKYGAEDITRAEERGRTEALLKASEDLRGLMRDTDTRTG